MKKIREFEDDEAKERRHKLDSERGQKKMMR